MNPRSGLLLAVSILLCASVSASDVSQSTCGRATDGVDFVDRLAGTPGQPLDPDQRLLYELPDPAVAGLEIRYRIESRLEVTETADLGAESAAGVPVGRSAAEPRVIELLTLRPDLVRRLHWTAAAGSAIEVELVGDGAVLETLAFGELLAESAALRRRHAEPVLLHTTVGGPGAALPPVPRPESSSGCGFCDSTVPCDAVGPFDPGKGGCVLCWEIGDCDPGPCDCETVLDEYWTDWFVTASVPLGPYRCVASWNERALRTRVTYRRNLIRLSRICPDCPGCTNCFNQEQIVNFQTQQVACYALVFQNCLPSDPFISASSVCP